MIGTLAKRCGNLAARGSRGLARAIATAAAVAIIGLVVASCAAPLRLPPLADPLALLPGDALVYARLDGEAARSLVPSLLPPGQKKALEPLLKRTTGLVISIGSSASSSSPAAIPAAGSEFDVEAAFIGDFPYRAASLVLGAQPGWKRDGDSFFNAGSGIRAAIPGPDLVLATTRDYPAMLARATAPGASPLPARLASLASRELLVYAPEPLKSLSQAIAGDAINVPLRGLLITATRKTPPAKGQETVYDATIAFLMTSPESARIFRPALRLAWFFIARSLLPDDSDLAFAARFESDGELYWASGVELRSSSLATALEKLQDAIAKREAAKPQGE